MSLEDLPLEELPTLHEEAGHLQAPTLTDGATQGASAPAKAVESGEFIGQTLAGFRIEGTIGHGGAGAVFRARQLSLGREIALKILRRDLVGDLDKARERMIRESQTIARLSHPHIVQALDAGTVNGQRFLAMELCPGGNLSSRIKKQGALEEGEALRIVYAITDALCYAESEGLIHRDIKPANILFGKSDTVKLCDLGLARLFDQRGQSALTQTGVILGTPYYMAPEQAIGEKNLDIRCDIYSLGVTLYEMLTGKVPFDGDTPLVVLNQHMNVPFPDPRELAPGLSEATRRIVLRMTAKEREDRPPSARALLDELDAVLLPRMNTSRYTAKPAPEAAEPQAQTLPERGTPTKPASTRRPRPVFIAVLALAIVVALLAVRLRQTRATQARAAQTGATQAVTSTPAPEPEPEPELQRVEYRFVDTPVDEQQGLLADWKAFPGPGAFRPSSSGLVARDFKRPDAPRTPRNRARAGLVPLRLKHDPQEETLQEREVRAIELEVQLGNAPFAGATLGPYVVLVSSRNRSLVVAHNPNPANDFRAFRELGLQDLADMGATRKLPPGMRLNQSLTLRLELVGPAGQDPQTIRGSLGEQSVTFEAPSEKGPLSIRVIVAAGSTLEAVTIEHAPATAATPQGF